MNEVVDRLTALGLYDHDRRRPIFGWRPVLHGWKIVTVDTINPIGIPARPQVFINGREWDGEPVSWIGNEYAPTK